MTARPVVSAVITAHNYGRFIGAAIESVLAQDFPRGDYEIVVVDNGSTDDTGAVVRGFGDRVRYHYQECFQGQVGSLNSGARLARGQFVMLMDADDMWVPEKFKEVVGRFEAEPDLGAVQHGYEAVDAGGARLGEIHLPPKEDRITLEMYLERPFWIGHISDLSFRKEVLDQLAPMPADFAVVLPDNYLFFHSLFFAPAGNIHKALTLYRRHGTAWSDRWGAAKADPKALATGYRGQRMFDRRLKRRLRERGLVQRWPEEELAPRRRERIELLLLWNAHLGRSSTARRLFCRLQEESLGLGARVFKSLALGLALVSPGLYGPLYRLYRRLRVK